jgi:hypothetical protein
MPALPFPRRRSSSPKRHLGLVLALIAGGAIVGLTTEQFAGADVTTGDRPVFVPIDPCRLADTRPAPNNVGPRDTPIGTAETVTFTAHGTNGDCTVPADAVGLSLNVTALGATEQTFLTIWPSGTRPLAASLNPSPGEPPTPNAVNAPLSGTGTFEVYNDRGSVHVVVDVNGYYAHHDHDDRYYTRSQVDSLLAAAPTTTDDAQPYPALVHGRPIRSDALIDSSGNASHSTELEVDPRGRPIIAWIDQTAGAAMVSRCAEPSCSTVTTTTATPANSATQLIDMELDSAGDPVLLTSGPGNIVSVHTCVSFCVGGSTTDFAGVARSGGLVMTRDDLPILVYENDTSDEIEITSCLDPQCISSTTSALAPTGNLADVDVMMSPDGFPIVAYSNDSERDVVVIACRTVDCVGSPAPVSTVVDSAGFVGNGLSMTMDADGNPAIAYRDRTNKVTKVARCNNPTCSGPDPASLSTLPSGDEGLAIDIAIASATGLPIVASWIPTGVAPSRLQAEICLDLTCSSSDMWTLADPGGVTLRPSLAISAFGVPMAAWIDPVDDHVVLSYLGGASSTPNGWD